MRMFWLSKFFSILLVVFSIVGCRPALNQTSSGSLSNKNQHLADVNVQLGIGYLKQGDIPRAKFKLLTALEKAPNWPPALAAMAYFYQVTGEQAKAKSYYLNALHFDPTSGSTLNNYGAFLCQQGSYHESLQYFERAMADTHYLNSSQLYENAGLCAAKIPDYARAEAYLLKSLQQNPSRSLPLLDLADIAYSQAQYREALNYLNAYAKQTALNAHYNAMQAELIRKLKA